jgi:hypothetical protein
VRKEGAAFPMHLLTSPIADLKKGIHIKDPRGSGPIEDITSQKALSKKYGTHYTR